jgi:hypothetical protein
MRIFLTVLFEIGLSALSANCQTLEPEHWQVKPSATIVNNKYAE